MLSRILPLVALLMTSGHLLAQSVVPPSSVSPQHSEFTKPAIPSEVNLLQKTVDQVSQQTQTSAVPAAQASSPSDTREVKVTKVATRGSGENMTGATGELVIRISPNKSKRSAVAFMEEFAGGIGDMGRGAGWLAAFNSSLLTGHRITDYEFTFKSYGYSDGPSAGMLTTAALLALINNVAVREDTTMTGTINPDGTCGPVGGIPFKMEAAAKAGLKRFGYPTGSRLDSDKTGEVDLKEKARSLGMEAREIDDVYEAYEWLTGKVLHRSRNIEMDEMDIPISSNNRLRADLTTTLTDLKAQIQRLPSISMMNERLKKQSGYYSQDTINLRNMLGKFANDIDTYLSDGEIAAAYLNLQRALMTARMLEHGWDEISQGNQMVKNENLLAYAMRRLGAVEEKIEAARLNTRASSESKHPATLLNTLNASVSLAEAEALQRSARIASGRMQTFMKLAVELHEKSQSATKSERSSYDIKLRSYKSLILKFYDQANTLLARAETRAEMVRLALTTETETGNDLRFDASSFYDDGRAYASGASAILAYFESIVLQQQAEDEDETMSSIRLNFEWSEPIYPALQRSNDSSYSVLQETDRKGVPPEMSSSLNILGAGVFCYLGSSSLVNKHYCLAPKQDADGSIKFLRRKALGNMLNGARAHALERAHDAKEAIGMLPQSVRFNFHLAEALRESNDDSDKLAALDAYWRASLICEIGTNVARDVKANTGKPQN